MNEQLLSRLLEQHSAVAAVLAVGVLAIVYRVVDRLLDRGFEFKGFEFKVPPKRR